MTESYSTNITVAAGSLVPFNVTDIQKGCTSVLSGTSSFNLNKSGVYMITVNAYGATAETSGNVGLQLFVNGNAVTNAEAQELSTATTDIVSIAFSKLVQVPNNNTCACNTSPTVVTVEGIGETALWNLVNVVITKIC